MKNKIKLQNIVIFMVVIIFIVLNFTLVLNDIGSAMEPGECGRTVTCEDPPGTCKCHCNHTPCECHEILDGCHCDCPWYEGDSYCTC